MKKIALSLAAVAVSVAGSSAVLAAELPSYEVNGFPISPVQARVLGAAHVQEQPAASSAIASPVQVSVLTPRNRKTATTAPITSGVAH